MQEGAETINADFTYTRMGRLDYIVFCVLIFLALAILANLLGEGIGIFWVAWQICIFVLFVKRLHDTGAGGWWSLLSLVPYVGNFFILYLCFAPGDAESNKFGPPPKSIVRGWFGAA
jgi:uncharacterized membrane protein YhaH (DUF805 family)